MADRTLYYKEYYARRKEYYANKRRIYYFNNLSSFQERRIKYRAPKREATLLKRKRREFVKLLILIKRAKSRSKPERLRRQREYHNKLRHRDLNRKISGNLRSRLNSALKGKAKSGSAIKYLGCSVIYLRLYLESQFEDGMSWKNYGQWHIDHIVPFCAFDLTKKENLAIVCHYKNLRPLWARENFLKIKSDKSYEQVSLDDKT